MTTVLQTFDRARGHPRVGRLQEAAQLDQPVLHLPPQQGPALPRLGLNRHQAGQQEVHHVLYEHPAGGRALEAFLLEGGRSYVHLSAD